MNMRIEIKICGLTSPAVANACAAMGADAIGMVFHPASPRHLQTEQAQEIAIHIPAGVAKVGIFVDQTMDAILHLASQIRLDAVQLYGAPAGYDYEAFAREGLHVVQVLRSAPHELPALAAALPPSVGILVECGRGTLPGGNGAAWNWSDAAVLREIRPFALAGGLDADHVAQALTASGASAVDVSSGVEAAPGIKDLGKVTAFIAAVRASGARSQGQVFRSCQSSADR